MAYSKPAETLAHACRIGGVILKVGFLWWVMAGSLMLPMAVSPSRLDAQCLRPGDFNLNDVVDVLDLVIFASYLVGNVPAGLPVDRCRAAAVPKTGQTFCVNAENVPTFITPCPGTPAGQDGALQKGVAYPTARFTDNGNGTVTDNLTSLIWLKNASCFGLRIWSEAMTLTTALASGACQLTDGTSAGSWRLPNKREMFSLVDDNYFAPCVPNTAGTGQWTAGNPFVNLKSNYWSSSTVLVSLNYAWTVDLSYGGVSPVSKSNGALSFSWPVRGVTSGSRLDAQCLRSGDFNLDGMVDVLDLVIFAGYLVGNVPAGLPMGNCHGTAVPKTGQSFCVNAEHALTPCPGTPAGQDGALQKGAAYPNPRFTDNGNGTVTDNLTSLIWLKNANCFSFQDWGDAMNLTNTLASGACGLTDGSIAAEWRVPNKREMFSLVDDQYIGPCVPNTAGTGQWTAGNPFVNLQSNFYWSSSTDRPDFYLDHAWGVLLAYGHVQPLSKASSYFVWPVRGGP